MGPFAALLPAIGAAMGTIGGTAAAGGTAGAGIMGLTAAQAGMLGGAIGGGLGLAAADMVGGNQQPGMPSQGMPAPPPMVGMPGMFGSGGLKIEPNSLIVPTQLPPPMFPTQTGMTREREEYLRRFGLI